MSRDFWRSYILWSQYCSRCWLYVDALHSTHSSCQYIDSSHTATNWVKTGSNVHKHLLLSLISTPEDVRRSRLLVCSSISQRRDSKDKMVVRSSSRDENIAGNKTKKDNDVTSRVDIPGHDTRSTMMIRYFNVVHKRKYYTYNLDSVQT